MYWSQLPSGRESLWKTLAAMETRDVSRRSLAQAGAEGYTVKFLDREYRVDPASGRLGGPVEDLLLRDPEFELLLLTYLTQAREIPPQGSWISEKDLPGGSLFFRGPHALPVQPLIRRFGSDPAAFRLAGQRLGGQPLPFGDAAYGFQALPRIPAACVLWIQDEEFPARVTMMFDRTLSQHLPLDVVLAVAHCLSLRLQEEAGPPA
jgi:hypothetical protein